MECITACPDTALPNTAQDVTTVLKTAVNQLRHRCRRAPEAWSTNSKGIEERARAKMNERGRRPRRRCRSRTSSATRSTALTDVADEGEEPSSPASSTSCRWPTATSPPSSARIETEDARRGRPVLHLRHRPLQRLRRMRAGLRRSRRAAHDARDRGAERRPDHRADLLAAAARHAAEVSRPLQRRRRRRIRARPRCAIT